MFPLLGQERVPHRLGPNTAVFPHAFGPGNREFPHLLGPNTATFPHAFGPRNTEFPHRLGPNTAVFPHTSGRRNTEFPTPFEAEHSGVSTYFWAKKHRVSHTKLCGNSAETLWKLCGNSAETLRKLCGNFAETLRKLCGNSAETLQKICGNFKRNSAETRPKGLTALELLQRTPDLGQVFGPLRL